MRCSERGIASRLQSEPLVAAVAELYTLGVPNETLKTSRHDFARGSGCLFCLFCLVLHRISSRANPFSRTTTGHPCGDSCCAGVVSLRCLRGRHTPYRVALFYVSRDTDGGQSLPIQFHSPDVYAKAYHLPPRIPDQSERLVSNGAAVGNLSLTEMTADGLTMRCSERRHRAAVAIGASCGRRR